MLASILRLAVARTRVMYLGIRYLSDLIILRFALLIALSVVEVGYLSIHSTIN